MVKTPWYKKVSVWFVVAGAMVVGALILVGRWVRKSLKYPPPSSAVPPREATDQDLEDEIDSIETLIDQQIEEMDRARKIKDSDTIRDINIMLGDAREKRASARNRRADRNNDGD